MFVSRRTPSRIGTRTCSSFWKAADVVACSNAAHRSSDEVIFTTVSTANSVTFYDNSPEEPANTGRRCGRLHETREYALPRIGRSIGHLPETEPARPCNP